MSRFLSEALGKDEPRYKQAIMGQERRSGHPSNDLRLTSKVIREVRSKVIELGLDPSDTTSEELYYALNHKLAAQEKQLNKYLRSLVVKNVNAEANLSDGLIELVKMLDSKDNNFALKCSVLKKQLKQNPPKKVMKLLGYRSVDSMLKLEPVQLVMLAINFYESEAYIVNFYQKHKKFTAADFETRRLKLLMPKSKKWQKVLDEIKSKTGLVLISDYETASIILLPINNQPTNGYLSVVIANLVSEISIIYSVSNYLKLHQVNKDFGQKLVGIIEREPYLDATAVGSKISFRAAQHKLKELDSSPSPHISLEEIEPVNLLANLGDLVEDFKFWQDTDFLAFVKAAQTTSLNLLDVALNLANNLPFSNRKLDHLRHSLTQELNKMYIDSDQVVDSLYQEDDILNDLVRA